MGSFCLGCRPHWRSLLPRLAGRRGLGMALAFARLLPRGVLRLPLGCRLALGLLSPCPNGLTGVAFVATATTVLLLDRTLFANLRRLTLRGRGLGLLRLRLRLWPGLSSLA